MGALAELYKLLKEVMIYNDWPPVEAVAISWNGFRIDLAQLTL